MDIAQNKTVINYGEPGDKFYLILGGEVSVTIPNPGIKGWKDHRNVFEQLKHWEETSFKHLREKARCEFMKQDEIRRSFEDEFDRFIKIKIRKFIEATARK